MDANMQKQAAEAVLRRIRSNRFKKRAAASLRKTAQEVDPYVQGLVYRNNLDLNDKDDLAYLERMLKQHDIEYKQPKTTWQASLSGFNEGAKDGMKVVRNTATRGLNKRYRQSAEEAMRGYSKGIRALTELSAATGVGALVAAGLFAAPEAVAAARAATLPGALKAIGGGTVRLGGKALNAYAKYVYPVDVGTSIVSAWDEYANGRHPGETAHGDVKDISVPIAKTLGEAVWFAPTPVKWLNKGAPHLVYGMGASMGANWYADKRQQDVNARAAVQNQPALQSLAYIDRDDPYGTAKGQWSPKKR